MFREKKKGKKVLFWQHARRDLQWTPPFIDPHPTPVSVPPCPDPEEGRGLPRTLTERGRGGRVGGERCCRGRLLSVVVVGQSESRPVMVGALRRGRILEGYNTPSPSAWFRSGWKVRSPADPRTCATSESKVSPALPRVSSCLALDALLSLFSPPSLPLHYLDGVLPSLLLESFSGSSFAICVESIILFFPRVSPHSKTGCHRALVHTIASTLEFN